MSKKHLQIVTLPTYAGQTFKRTAERAQQLALDQGAECRFDFNGAEVRVRADSKLDRIQRDFDRAMSGHHEDPVGPYPPAKLSAEALLADRAKRRELEAKRAARRAEAQRQDAEKRSLFEKQVEGVEMSVTDPDAWATIEEANADPYGSAIVRYAQAWARLMQSRMAQGYELEAVAQPSSFDANLEHITGFMYGAAVAILASTWEHGERLRRWHNRDTQIANEGEDANESGGVLNPAMLTTTRRAGS